MRGIFEYGTDEIEYLKRRDVILGNCIDKIGFIERETIPDLFAALVNCIIGQQISSKALVTVWNRLLQITDKITPGNISKLSELEIQQCGMTLKKANYIKELAGKILLGEFNIDALIHLNDDEVCKCLCALKGIGVWTAEMLMIFSMKRKNIFSFNDLAIHRGLRMLYGHESITKEMFQKYHQKYSPYATIASFYLWEISLGK